MASEQILRRHGFTAMGSVFSTWGSPRGAPRASMGGREPQAEASGSPQTLIHITQPNRHAQSA